MTEQTPQKDIDVVAVSNQIRVLKEQRSAAMDDVAVLLGQVASLRNQLQVMKDKYEPKEETNADKPSTEAVAA